MNAEYIITVKTGDLTNAGTDGEVKIQVIGKSLLWTEPTVLDHAFDNDFEQNQTTRYSVTMKDIGEPIVCKIRKFLDALFLIRKQTWRRCSAETSRPTALILTLFEWL